MTSWSTRATTESIARDSLARWLLPWIPRPELWLVFDVPSEVLQTRTREVAAEEAARLRSEYRKVLRRREDVVVLDAEQPHR